MDQWDVTLAKLFKSRNNPTSSNAPLVAKVNAGIPNLSLSLGEEIVLDGDDLVIANRMYHLPVPLVPGDYVIVQPSADGQTYFVMDKAGE